MTIVFNDANKKVQSTLTPADPLDITNVSWAPGSNRVGILMLAGEDSGTGASPLPSAVTIDPGGSDEAPFVLLNDNDVQSTNTNWVAIWGLKEANIPDASKTLRIDFANAANNVRVLTGITLTGVDQVNFPGAAQDTDVTTTGTTTSGSVTNAQNSIILNAWSGDANTAGPTADGTQTEIDTGTLAGVSPCEFGFAYEIESTAGPNSYGWTHTSQGRRCQALVELQEAVGQSVQVQHRRGLDASVSTFIGAAGELIWNITNQRIHMQDGLTGGGIIVPKVNDLFTGTFTRGTVGGTSNAITVTLPVNPGVYTNGMIVEWEQAGNNTAATTIDVNGIGVKNLVRTDGNAHGGGELRDDGFYSARYSLVDDQFKMFGAGAGGIWDLLERNNITSGVTEVILDTGTWSDYDKIRVEFSAVEHSVNNATLRMTASSDGGSSFKTGSIYGIVGLREQGTGATRNTTAATPGVAGQTEWGLLETYLPPVDKGYNGIVELSGTHEAASLSGWSSFAAFDGSTETDVTYQNVGLFLHEAVPTQIDALRAFPGSGNISDGVISLYGLRNN